MARPRIIKRGVGTIELKNFTPEEADSISALLEPKQEEEIKVETPKLSTENMPNEAYTIIVNGKSFDVVRVKFNIETGVGAVDAVLFTSTNRYKSKEELKLHFGKYLTRVVGL